MKSSATTTATPPSQGQNLSDWPFNETTTSNSDSNQYEYPPYGRPFSRLLASAQRRAARARALSGIRLRSAGGNGVRSPSPSDGHRRFSLRRQIGTPIINAVRQRLTTPVSAVQRVWNLFHHPPTQGQVGLGDDHPPSDFYKQHKLIASTEDVIDPAFHDKGTNCIASPSILFSILEQDVQEPCIEDDVDTRIAQVFTHKADLPNPPPSKKLALRHLLSRDLFGKILSSTGRRDNANLNYYTISVLHPRSKIKHKKDEDEIQRQISNTARFNHIILYLYKNDLVALLEEDEGRRRSFLVPASQYSAQVFYLPANVVTDTVATLKQDEEDQQAAVLAEAAAANKSEEYLEEVLSNRESMMVKAGITSATEAVFDTKYIKIFVGRAYEFNDEAIKKVFQTYGHVVLSGRNEDCLFLVMFQDDGATAISGVNTESLGIIVRKAQNQSIRNDLLLKLEDAVSGELLRCVDCFLLRVAAHLLSLESFLFANTHHFTIYPRHTRLFLASNNEPKNTQGSSTAACADDVSTPSRSLNTQASATAAAFADDATPSPPVITTADDDVKHDNPSDSSLPPRLEEETPILTHAQQHVVKHYGSRFFDSTGRCIHFNDQLDNDLIDKCLGHANYFGLKRKTKPCQPEYHGLTHQRVLEAKLRIIKTLLDCPAPGRDNADKYYLCAATIMLEPGDYTNILLMHCRLQYQRGGHSLERQGFCNKGHIAGNCCTSRCVSVVDSAMYSSIVTGKVLKHNLCFNGNSKCTTSDDETKFKRCGRTSAKSGGSLASLLNTFIAGMKDICVNIFAHCMSGMSCKVPEYVMDKLTRLPNLVVCDTKNYHAQFFETRCLQWTILQQRDNMTGYIEFKSKLYDPFVIDLDIRRGG